MNITTQNLVIREFTLYDASVYYENNQDEQIKKYMPNHTHGDEDEAREEIKSFIANYVELAMPCHWAIAKADTGVLIGHIGIGEGELNKTERHYEICCGISKNHRGHNYAAEASVAFSLWCKGAFDIDKIYASTKPANVVSGKTLLNAGFALEETDFGEEKYDIFVF
jgi:RimJ/RimL family protein N-acetyltransferase